jgi:hypothetical protein
MVATAAEIAGGGWGDQMIAQSDHSISNGDWSYGQPGAHMDYTMAYT